MAILNRTLLLAALTALAGCYSPELHDCTVSCGSDGDCLGDQTCHAGLCTAAGASCDSQDQPDARETVRVDAASTHDAHADDASHPDAAATPDAATAMVKLVVTVSGNGRVVVDGDTATECGSAGPPPMTACTYMVTSGASHTLVATLVPGGSTAFQNWSGACSGNNSTCSIAPTHDVMAGAKFHP